MAAKPFASGHILAAADVNDLVGVYHRDPSTVDAVSSTSPFVIYEPTIGAGHMSTDRMVRITVGGDVLQNASAVLTLAVRVGSTLWQSTVTLGNDGDRAAWRMVIELQNRNSASVQRLQGLLTISDRTAPAVGQGSDGTTSSGGQFLPFGGTGAENTAVAQSIGLIATWNANSVNASFRKLSAITELL